MTKEAQPYLLRIERAIVRINTYRPATEEEFFQQEPLQSEILMQLFQIGENLSHIRRLDQNTFSKAPVSWHQLIGLRNIIAHGYETINPELRGRANRQCLHMNRSAPILKTRLEHAVSGATAGGRDKSSTAYWRRLLSGSIWTRSSRPFAQRSRQRWIMFPARVRQQLIPHSNAGTVRCMFDTGHSHRRDGRSSKLRVH